VVLVTKNYDPNPRAWVAAGGRTPHPHPPTLLRFAPHPHPHPPTLLRFAPERGSLPLPPKRGRGANKSPSPTKWEREGPSAQRWEGEGPEGMGG